MGKRTYKPQTKTLTFDIHNRMHFTDKLNWNKAELKICTDALSQYHKLYTQGWVDYYSSPKNKQFKTDKPTDSGWTNEKIKNPLVGIFERNCGYCGRHTILATKVDQTGSYPKGQVDHYEPKSEVPSRVYDWENYVWTCLDCNSKKSDFFETGTHIFNPCCKTDMEMLEFDPQDGGYNLKINYKTNKTVQKRYSNSRQRTMFIEDDLCKQRALLFDEITELLSNIERYSKSALYRNFSKDKLNTYIKQLKNKINKNQNYRKLQRQIVTDFCKRNPKFAFNFKDFGL